MDMPTLAIGILVGATVGFVIAWLINRSRLLIVTDRLAQASGNLAEASREADENEEEIQRLRADLIQLETTLEYEKKAADEKIALLNKATEELRTTFKALSSDALKSNSQSFLDLAKAVFEKFQSHAVMDLEKKQESVEKLVLPLKESLVKVSTQVEELEKSRKQAYGSLSEQVKSLISVQEKLRSETGNLVKALRAPNVRGRWGEIQLKRVVEIAGMLQHCDFFEQESKTTEDGRLRPDLIVKLPGGKNIVVDAKAPLKAYLDAIDIDDEQLKIEHLKEHSRQIRDHIGKLSAKAYWEQFDPTPEFVIMFLPGEAFFSAALEHDPSLIEEGVNQRVIISSPTTLISLLRAVSYGWRQERIAESAQAISNLGRELYDRIRLLADHFSGVGKNLDRAVESYNKAIGSLEGRVLSSARRFAELGADSNSEIQILAPVEKSSRDIRSPELIDANTSESE